MKKIIYIAMSLLAITTLHASELAQALYDNSSKLVELREKCGKTLGEVTSREVEDGIFKHKMEIYQDKGMMGRTLKCRFSITQDYTPTWADGRIEYKLKTCLL